MPCVRSGNSWLGCVTPEQPCTIHREIPPKDSTGHSFRCWEHYLMFGCCLPPSRSDIWSVKGWGEWNTKRLKKWAVRIKEECRIAAENSQQSSGWSKRQEAQWCHVKAVLVLQHEWEGPGRIRAYWNKLCMLLKNKYMTAQFTKCVQRQEAVNCTLHRNLIHLVNDLPVSMAKQSKGKAPTEDQGTTPKQWSIRLWWGCPQSTVMVQSTMADWVTKAKCVTHLCASEKPSDFSILNWTEKADYTYRGIQIAA